MRLILSVIFSMLTVISATAFTSSAFTSSAFTSSAFTSAFTSTANSPKPRKGAKSMKESRLKLKAGETGIVDGKLSLSVLKIGSESHSISDANRSAPAMHATTVQLKVELGESSETLHFLTAYAGFVTNETEDWKGYRIHLESVSYQNNTETANFIITPLN
jgi:hypothetical protein